MFIALYEFTIKPGMSDDFRRFWLATTKGIYEEFGSKGSRLHATDNELVFVGYAQWPSREVWAEQHTFSNEQFVLARKNMRDCIASSKTVYEMEVTDDYLQHS